jgi:tetratricopeptide (TPR) repeat protein
MNIRTKILLIVGLLVVGVVDICVYRSNESYRQAKGMTEPESKIRALRKASGIFPWNDLVYYELGKIYFRSGIQRLMQGQDARSLVKESVGNLDRSLKINPASPYAHFYYAQSLQYEALLERSSGGRVLAEFQNAAKLAGDNREMLFDVGKRYLAHWETLDEEGRNFLRGILTRALEWKPVDKFPALLNLWHLNVREEGFMESVMPDDPRLYRMFGNYLGEKSLFLEARHRILSRADQLEFAIQINLLKAGNREMGRSNWGEAKKFFRWCLGNLPKIRFFCKISGLYPLENSEFQRVYTLANLGLARGILESGGSIEDAREYVLAYFENANDQNSLRDLESILVRKKISDPDILLYLYHKQGRYHEIVDAAERRKNQAFSARALYLIGDACQRIGKPWDAAGYFDRSLLRDSKNLKTLLPIRRFYENLNNQDEIFRINVMIERTVVSKDNNVFNMVIQKHKDYTWQLPFDGRAIDLDLYFRRTDTDRAPLITVEFNQEVLWDNFLAEDSFTVPVKTVLGNNILRVSAVDCPVIFQKMSYSYR